MDNLKLTEKEEQIWKEEYRKSLLKLINEEHNIEWFIAVHTVAKHLP